MHTRGSLLYCNYGEWISGVCFEHAPLAYVLSVTGHLLVQTLQRIGASGWSVLKMLLSVLWLAVLAPGACISFVC